ncbi:MAG: hypothetical protein ABI851_02240 [Saprospiraceae bacterium]
MNRTVAYIIYVVVGIASLNIFHNYNSAYVYAPGDGAAASRSTSLSTPGDGAAASRATALGSPGGSGGVETCCPDAIPGGFESSYYYILNTNLIFLIISIIGALIGGFLIYYNFQDYREKIYGGVLMAFLFSRAALYLAVLIRDIWIHSN